MPKVKTIYEDCDILVVGGGMAGTGATFEARHWGRDLKIICVEKANIDRSGAVAQVFMQLIVIWACNGMKISLKIMCVTLVTI